MSGAVPEKRTKTIRGVLSGGSGPGNHLPALHCIKCISCDLGDHARASPLSQISLQKMTKAWNTHEPGLIATLDGQRSELVRSLLPFIATPDDEPKPFRVADADLVPRLQRGPLPRCGSSHRSAIAAVTPDGGSHPRRVEYPGQG